MIFLIQMFGFILGKMLQQTKSFSIKKQINRSDYCKQGLTESEPVSSNSLGELDVSGHDCHSLGMDSAEVGVFEEGDEVGLSSFLESQDGGALESEFLFEFVSDFSDESLEGEFSDEEIS